MAGRNIIQFLRTTNDGINKHQSETLKPGQPLYNTSRNTLTIGGGSITVQI